MGGFKRRLMELEEIYGPAWTWDGVWEDPDSYPCSDKIQEIVCKSFDQHNEASPDQNFSDVDPALENDIEKQ